MDIILLQIENSINYQIDPQGGLKCILYKCMQKCVNFNVDEHLPLIGTETNINKIVKLYYDVYDANKNIDM